MAGRLEGLSDLEWQMVADLFSTPLKRAERVKQCVLLGALQSSKYEFN